MIDASVEEMFEELRKYKLIVIGERHWEDESFKIEYEIIKKTISETRLQGKTFSLALEYLDNDPIFFKLYEDVLINRLKEKDLSEYLYNTLKGKNNDYYKNIEALINLTLQNKGKVVPLKNKIREKIKKENYDFIIAENLKNDLKDDIVRVAILGKYHVAGGFYGVFDEYLKETDWIGLIIEKANGKKGIFKTFNKYGAPRYFICGEFL